jgi:hypothetical protein
MKKHYEVMFGKQGVDRDYKEFTSIKKAQKFAEQMVKERNENVFIDTYEDQEEGDQNLTTYKQYN